MPQPSWSPGGDGTGYCGEHVPGWRCEDRGIHDPGRVESNETHAEGLALLDTETTFASTKATFQARARIARSPGWLAALEGQELDGYEIHMGRTEGASPWLEIVARNREPAQHPDGAASSDGRIWGCYLHGLFANDVLRRALLVYLAGRRGLGADPRWGEPSPASERYDRLADIVAASCDLGAIGKLVGLDLTRAASARSVR